MQLKKDIKYIHFLYQLVLRDIKKKYYNSVLGLLWTLLNPLLMMIVITIVFSTAFEKAILNYPLYYICGALIFNFNITATKQSLHSMVVNSPLFKKIYLPKYMFVLSTVAVNLFNLLFSFVALFIVILFTSAPITTYFLLLPIPILLLTFFTTGLSLILSTYAVFFRDLDHIYDIFSTAWIYLTPIFYPISIIPKQFLFLFELNPMYHFVNIFRDLIYSGAMPSKDSLIIATAFSFLTLFLGIVTFGKNEGRFYLYT